MYPIEQQDLGNHGVVFVFRLEVSLHMTDGRVIGMWYARMGLQIALEYTDWSGGPSIFNQTLIIITC